MSTNRRFTTRAFVALAAVAVIMTASIAAPSSAARGRKTSVDGTWATTAATVVDQQQLGALLHLHEQGAAAFDGDLVGTTTFDLQAFLRADFSSFGWATEFFTGTLDGRTGTLLFVEKARVGADGSARIDATVVYGTGAFEGMHGEIRFVSDLCVPETCTGTYSGELKP